MTNHKIVLQTFERSAALQRVERLRLYLSGADNQENMPYPERDLFEEHRDAFLHLARRQSKTIRRQLSSHWNDLPLVDTVPSLPQQRLPDIRCQYLTINVSTVVDVNHFWAQHTDHEANAQMRRINDNLSRPLTPLAAMAVEVGMMCAAPFMLAPPRAVAVATPDDHDLRSGSSPAVKRYQYYRARITHRLDNVTVEVFFVDWGNTEHVSIDQRELRGFGERGSRRADRF